MTREGDLAIDLMMQLEEAQLNEDLSENELLIEVAKIVSEWKKV